MIMAPDQASPRATLNGKTPICGLTEMMMNCCREAVSAQERQRFGEVLGAIGAIDPDRYALFFMFRSVFCQ